MRYLLSPELLARPGLRLVSSDGAEVYENLQPAARAWLRSGDSRESPIAVSDPSPNRVLMKLPARSGAGRPASVLLLDAFYPGWSFTASGRPTRVRAAGAFRLIEVPTGAARLEGRYQPTSFRAGLFLSLLGLLALCAAVSFLLSFPRDGPGR